MWRASCTQVSRALDFGGISASGSGAIFEKNKVLRVFANSTGTYGAYGINLGGGNAHVVRNNFVTNVNGDMTGGIAFDTGFGLFGIRVAAGNDHKIYHNSVNLFGTRPGTANSSLLGASLGILATTQTGIDVRNNILANTLTGGTTSVAYVSLYLPPSGTSTMNLTINSNDYFSGTTAGQSGIAHVGSNLYGYSGRPSYLRRPLHGGQLQSGS